MLRRVLALGILLGLLCVCSLGAHASPGDIVLFGVDEEGKQSIYPESSCVVDGVLYIMANNAIYRWTPGDAEPSIFYQPASTQEIPADGENPASEGEVIDLWQFRAMVNWGGKLAGYNSTTGKFSELTADGPQLMDIQMDATSIPGAPSDQIEAGNLIDSLIVAGDRLFAIARPSDMDWDTLQLYSVDTASGAMKQLTEKDARIISGAPYKDGKLLLGVDRSRTSSNEDDAYPKLWQWDIAGERFEGDGFRVGESWYLTGLNYDPVGDYIYLAQGTRLMRARWGEAAEPVNFLSKEMYNGRGASALIGDKLVLMSYEGIFVVSVDPSLIPKRILKVSGDWGGDQAYTSFAATHPDVAIDRLDIGIYNVESLTTAMAGGEGPDVFTYGSYGDLNQLFDKGYARDLSGDAALMEKVEALYPQLKQIILRDGKLYGYPMSMSTGLWAYDAAAFEQLGIEFPETFADLLDLIVNWEDDYQDEVDGRPLTDTYLMEKSQMFSIILNAYMQQYEQPDQPMHFDTPQFREVMEALERSPLKQMTDEEREQQYRGVVMMDGDEYKEPLIDTYGSFWSARSDHPKTLILPPKLSKDSERIAMGDVTLYVVNPTSENADLALEYINHMADKMQASERYALNPSLNDPVQSAYYEDNIKWYHDRIKELEERPTDPATKRDRDAELEDINKQLEESERWRWDISAESIEQYRALAPEIRIATSMMMYNSSVSEELSKIIERYRQRQLNLEQMIREMNQKAEMIFLETR